MKANKTNLFRIAAPKVAVKTIGYINLESRTRAESKKGKVRLFKTKAGRNIARKVKALKVAAQRAKAFAAAFVKSARLESLVNDTRKAMKQGYKQFLTHAEKFALYVNFCKSINSLRAFKYSLPSSLRVNLF